ncbi:MAG: glycosyltransferase family 2 protein [Rubrivivax sp.]|nr:glycosyltransferase family 2 protein [Rubrivivax sp.]
MIPLYNKRDYIVEAVHSVLAQTHPASELLVVDDGSTDGSADLVRALGDERIRVVRQANAGVSAARNHGIRLAVGDLVAFLDADDRWHPEFLASVTGLAQRYPAAGLLCTGYARISPTGGRNEKSHPRFHAGQIGLVRDFYADWARRSFTCTSAIAVPRHLLVTMDEPFPLGERLGEDQDLWFRLAEVAPVAYCNRPLADYRQEVAQSATQSGPPADVLPCYRRLAARLARGEVPVPLRKGAQRLLACHLINLARQHARAGRPAQAASLLGDRRARANLPYWLRSRLWLALQRRRIGPIA